MNRRYHWIKNNIKQIIKPDWRRILIFVLIASTLFLYSYYDNKAASIFSLTPAEYKFFLIIHEIRSSIMDIPENFLLCSFGDVIDWCSSFHEYLAYFWYFIVSYLISCIIVWIYDESGKNKYFRIAIIIIYLIIAYFVISNALGLWPFCRFIGIFGVGEVYSCSIKWLLYF